MYDLTALRDATDEILYDTGALNLQQFHEPINWADLHCFEASYVRTDDDCEYYRVLIEEAAPECPKFRAYIAGRLAERGFKDVQVVTEW